MTLGRGDCDGLNLANGGAQPGDTGLGPTEAHRNLDLKGPGARSQNQNLVAREAEVDKSYAC